MLIVFETAAEPIAIAEDRIKRHRPYGRDPLVKNLRLLDRYSVPLPYDKEELINKLVQKETFNPASRCASEEFVQSIKKALLSFPRPILLLLFSKHCKIYAQDYVVNACPELRNRQASETGETYESEASIFDHRKNVIIMAQFIEPNGAKETVSDAPHIVLHEVGHSLDFYLKGPFKSVEFMSCYEADLANMPNKYKRDLEYYTDKSSSGPKETFAESVASVFGLSNSPRAPHFSEAFPRCISLIHKVWDVPLTGKYGHPSYRDNTQPRNLSFEED